MGKINTDYEQKNLKNPDLTYQVAQHCNIFFSAGGLEAFPFPEECRSVPGSEITAMLPIASEHQQVETPRSSSASDLHLSGLCRFLFYVLNISHVTFSVTHTWK